MASFLRKYGTGTGADVVIPIVKRAVADYALGADWTPAAGDVKVTKDGGAAANIATLPVAIAMGNGAVWKFVFADAELQAKSTVVTIVDAATKAVEDQALIIETYGHASALHPFDLGTAASAMTIAAVSGAVGSVTGAVGSVTGAVGSVTGNVTGSVGSVTGAVGSVTGSVGSVTGAVGSVTGNVGGSIGSLGAQAKLDVNAEADTALADYDAATGAEAAIIVAGLVAVNADTDDLQTRVIDLQARTPAALVAGRVDASVGAMAAGVVTAAAVATDAIDSDAVAASAVTEIQAGLATAAALVTAQADLDDVQTRIPAALVGGRMDASVGAVAAAVLTAAAFAAGALDANALNADAVTEIVAGVYAKTFAEPAGMYAWPPSFEAIVQRLAALIRNEIDSDANSVDVRNDADTANLWSYTSADDGTTYVSGEGA